MERDFWLERWRLGQIGFHQASINARLQRHWPSLGIDAGARVFVPLCGKSRDMEWLAMRGHEVLGVELSDTAARAFFDEARAPHEARQRGKFVAYESERVTILCGDFFDLTSADLAGVVGVFDRGALIALPPPMRARYAAHLLDTLPMGARGLLLTLEYDQSRADGPPFSVQRDEVEALFSPRCSVDVLDRSATEEMPPRFHAQGIREASESTYRLTKVR